jgi:hypothetical protein
MTTNRVTVDSPYVVPAKAGTYTPCPLDRLRLHRPAKTGVNALMSGPGFVSAFTRVFDALWAGTTQERGFNQSIKQTKR